MTEDASAIETGEGPGPAPKRAGMRWSLSNKLLLLTVLFVMVAEVLIYIPSIAYYRNDWLRARLESAALVAMAASAAGGQGLPAEVERSLLAAAGVEALALRAEGQRWFIAIDDMPRWVAAQYDLREPRPLESIRAAFSTLFSSSDAPLMVLGTPPPGSTRFEIVVRESELREAMLAHSRNILLLSLAISVITAILVYAALRFLFVRPMQGLSAKILAFATAPEDVATVIVPSGRGDEIGAAEARLAEMQTSLRDMLAQRRHLADLGLAVSKINHDLRNILASAQLFTDRMGSVDDPLAKSLAPKVIRAIDRAIDYTRSVLAYGQAREEPPRRQLLSLARLVDEVSDVLALPAQERVSWENRVTAEVEVDADPEQLFRVLMNLCRNAIQAVSEIEGGAVIRRVWVEGERQGSVTSIRVCDSGPGVPEKARAKLFLPFQGSARQGGTGLGLAIAAEIVRAHGGEIRLLDRSGAGAVFEVTIPDRPVSLEARRQAARG
jgi:signal transduction histidine kinase